MESVVLEEVFQTWKLFDDLVDSLLKPGSIDKGSIKVLANMVMSKQFSKTFLYNKEPGISFKDYRDIVDMYQSFTTWLLGQFFYLLSCDDGELIVDAQLSIIDQLSRTTITTYADLAKEYCKAFDILCRYLKNSKQAIKIEAFELKQNEELSKKLNLKRATIELKSENMCLKLLKKILKLVGYILTESVTFYSLDSYTYTALENLLFLLKKRHFELEIFTLFTDILERLNYNIESWDANMLFKLRSFFSLFEQLVYDFYSNNNPNQIDKRHFEKLLEKYLESSKKLKKDIGQNDKRICKFLIMFCLENSCTEKLCPSKKIQQISVQNYKETPNCNFGNNKFLISYVIKHNNAVFLGLIKHELFKDISDYYETHSHVTHINVFENVEMWKIFCSEFYSNVNGLECSSSQCKLEEKIVFLLKIYIDLLEIRLKFTKEYKNKECCLYFFSEALLLPKLISSICKHYSSCGNILDPILMLSIFVQHLKVTESKNIDIIYHLIACQLLIPLCYKSDDNLPINFIGNVGERGKLKADIKLMYSGICKDKRLKKADIFKVLNEFFKLISSGLMSNLNQAHIDQIEVLHMKVMKFFVGPEDPNIICQILEQVPHLLYLFSDKDKVLMSILLPILSSRENMVQQKIAEIIPTILCTSFSDYIKVIKSDSLEIICEKCILNSTEDKEKCLNDYLQNMDRHMSIKFLKNTVDLSSLTSAFLKAVLNYLIGTNDNVKIKTLEAMPSLSQHIPKFYSPDVTKTWIERAGETGVEVRNTLTKVVGRIISKGQNNPVIADATKKEVLEKVISTLTRLSKKSLQYSEYELQETLLSTVNEVAQLDEDHIKLECMKIMLYFVMVPTSSQSFIAVNKCCKISKKDGSGHLSLYKHNTEILCEVIVHLCYVNQYLNNSSIQESLVKVSVILGFDGVKDFLTKEAKKLLPFLVAKMVKSSDVSRLIEEMATIIEIDISDLMSRNYGNIFLHLFLNMDRGESRKCLEYLEKTAKLSGPKLRKLNIRVILNELLLNFHEKRANVLTALQRLVQEDNTTSTTSIEDYLQPYFLAFLLYFDLELTSEYSKKEKILLSLADLFKYLGPNRITPLRFKIIAMLQTTHYLKHPELTCMVWDSFVHSCDTECLGAHLATIFVAMLPLIEACPTQVNQILQYLVVENEKNLSSHIADLFFVNNSHLSVRVTSIIRKHRVPMEDLSLKEKIQFFLKYLKHDTLEVRIQSLRQLKTCLEQNREELDQMILGYNGIDGVLVELIDYLTLGCREKDEALKLACGDIFGELGAIEPSHLPRRYAQDNKSFIFFISDDMFIESALNELLKAFQTDKNARNTDRVALAIQEILKTYKISPVESDERNFIWKKFSEAQREVMTPLLKSKYICVENFTGYPCPLYGSSAGSTFHTWLYNWTCSLISTLPEEERSLLQSCFPSMKLDKRVMMHFLPYILLHSLLEGSLGTEEKSRVEIETILNSFNNRRTIDEKVQNNRPLPIPGITPISREVTAEEDKQIQCTKVVFILLDFLDRWLREWLWLKGQTAGTDGNYQHVKSFLKRFCKLAVARCNYKCGEYPRALMYLEDYITENPDETYGNLPFLAEIYAQLDEPDGVLGVEPLQQNEPNLEQRLLSLEVSGKLADAAAIYAQHMPRPLKLQHIQGLIQCYLDLDKANEALYFATGALDLQPEFGNMLLEMQAEPLWRLGKYEDLENLLNKPDIVENKSWGVQVGRSLVCIKKGERDEFRSVLETIKKQQVDSFGAASLEEGAYQHGYNYVTRLHCLNELEQIEKTLFELYIKPNDQNYADNIVKKLSAELQLRIKVVQESVRVIEPLLCVRRVALRLGREIVEGKAPQAVPFFDKLLGECWLQSVNVARTTGVHQQAYTYVLDAEKYNPPKLFIEKAKLHWLREEHEEALITLKRGLSVYIPDNADSQETQQAISRLDLEKKKLCAEARLLIATYNDAICSVDVEMNLQQYKESTEVYKEWEKSIVCLAQYQDRIFQNYSDEEKDVKANELQLHIINNFGKSLFYGTSYIYQSMPRLLSIWFDYGTRLLDVTNPTTKEDRRRYLAKMTLIIDKFLTNLPAFIFLTSFSQIISRIAHPQREVCGQLKTIVIKLMQHYPQQCLWMISSVIKSSYPTRAKRCQEILTDPRLKTQVMSRLVKDFTSLAEKLIELCNKEIAPDLTSASVNLLVRALPRMLNKGDFSEIMMPTHKFRKLIMPNPDFKNTQHNPFPNRYVHIVGIDDNITILASLQRPRKIVLRGSDGKGYTFMLKPKDDLRKDFRLMEFNDIVNHLLMRDAEARQRRLNIRLYSVAPLNEECGLIEWVDNLVGLRPVLMNLYKQKGLFVRPKEIKDIQCNVRDPLAKKRDIFCNVLLRRHPPVLGDWFRKTFPDAQTWLTARTGYIRTTAVISITGYILGLGDRHGENILLDSTCGDVVHVDFNCLFNKGETFEWPERVPFRLTQNMVSAMGPLGVEGVFRKSCEFTLRVLRGNIATLMSIVTPFVYDPLLSWPRNVPAAAQSSERVNEQALEHVKNIELRLQGKVKTRSRTLSQCLSVEGQTDYLINEAKSIDNLCQMYIGWGPYL